MKLRLVRALRICNSWRSREDNRARRSLPDRISTEQPTVSRKSKTSDKSAALVTDPAAQWPLASSYGSLTLSWLRDGHNGPVHATNHTNTTRIC